jgi:hypothetical protein
MAMPFLNWLRGRWTGRERSMAIYRRGMAHARLHDHEAALADYTSVIDMPGTPADIRAMALYNRAVVHTAGQNEREAIADLELLLELPGAAGNVRTEARRKLVRMQRSSARLNEPPAHGTS